VALLALLLLPGCGTSVAPDPNSDEPYARYLGALDLADRGDDAGVVRLLADPHPLVRSGAVLALARMGRAEYVPQVVDMIFERVEPGETESRNDPLVRSDACRALAKMRDARGLPPMISALRGDSSVDVRRTAALCLEAFADQPAALEALVDAVGDKTVPVAHNAHLVLCRIAKRTDLPRAKEPWSQWLKDRPRSD
jgi:HEAT repeat protein